MDIKEGEEEEASAAADEPGDEGNEKGHLEMSKEEGKEE
jgi:hypothetical protein